MTEPSEPPSPELTTPLAAAYEKDGFVTAVPILGAERALDYRRRMEAVEARYGPLHYVSKAHTIVASAAELATAPAVLEVVEQLIGPDILLFDVTYIVKEPHSPAFVSWHQDLTYWGFDGAQQVSMWLALTEATAANGCMRMVPGSHHGGQRRHRDVGNADNVLFRGQQVDEVNEVEAMACEIARGEASFHHGWTLHTSAPNRTVARRIGLNAQFIAPSMRQQVNPDETAVLVRGRDRYGYYAQEELASTDLAPEALARHARLDAVRKQTWAAVTAK